MFWFSLLYKYCYMSILKLLSLVLTFVDLAWQQQNWSKLLEFGIIQLVKIGGLNVESERDGGELDKQIIEGEKIYFY